MTTIKGGRPATGSIKWRRNPKTPGKPPYWHVRLTLADGSRPFVPLDPTIPREDVARAKAGAREVAESARESGTVPETTRETVSEYATRWHDWREARGLSCVKDDRARLNNHVLDEIGTLDVRAVVRRDLERLVETLDARIAKGTLGWKVAGMAWSNVARMFADACSAKKLDLRVRDDNPADHVQAPDVGLKKQKQYLWPTEFLALVSCPDVPLRWRRLFALAAYTYCRAGEIEALAFEDVMFDNATIHVHRSVDRVRRRGHVKSTKTGVSRRIPLEPELYDLLRTLHDEAGGKGRVVRKMPSPGMLSRKLRVYLARAGVTRAELFAENDPTRKAITFHDLRATGITWMAARGDDPLRIKQRAGHASFSTTEGYIREAENLGASFGTVFPPLPDLGRGSASVLDSAIVDETIEPKTRATGWAQQGLKPPPQSAPQAGKEGGSTPEASASLPEPPPASEPAPPRSRPPATGGTEPSEADLERGILDAIRLGLTDVARTLSSQLEERRRSRSRNVVDLAAERGRRGR